MDSPARPSAAAFVIAGAVVAILAGLLVFLSMALAAVGILLGTAQTASPGLPPFARTLALGFIAFTVCLSAFGIATGIGLILLRNWARISILVWGGCSVFFGVFGVAIAFLMPLPVTPDSPGLPSGALQSFRFFLLFIYGLPTIIGIWWLILFTRESVKAQFAGTASPPAPQKPRPPLPISIFAWFLIMGAANVVILPFLPFSIPVSLFGDFFYGTAATVAYVGFCMISALAGVGLLKLKPWSYTLAIVFQLFGLTNMLVTVLNPDYPSQMASFMEKIYASMHLPPNPYSSAYLLHARSFMAVVLAIFLGIIGMLFYYRPRFLEAAAAARSSSSL